VLNAHCTGGRPAAKVAHRVAPFFAPNALLLAAPLSLTCRPTQNLASVTSEGSRGRWSGHSRVAECTVNLATMQLAGFVQRCCFRGTNSKHLGGGLIRGEHALITTGTGLIRPRESHDLRLHCAGRRQVEREVGKDENDGDDGEDCYDLEDCALPPKVGMPCGSHTSTTTLSCRGLGIVFQEASTRCNHRICWHSRRPYRVVPAGWDSAPSAPK